MYVKRNKNRSGSVSIQVLRKVGRSNRLVKTFGTSKDEKNLLKWEEEARLWIEDQESLPLFDYEIEPITTSEDYDNIYRSIYQEDVSLVGPDLVYGRLFDKLGYNKVQTKNKELFKSLVVTRLYKPGSKARTSEYMAYFMNKYYEVSKIYRYLDEMCYRKEEGMTDAEMEAAEKKSIKYQAEQITYDYTKSVMGGNIAVVFYDTTSIYFESREDDIRVPGWSKDGKHNNPQVVLGLLVASGGCPIGYELHKGNTYEGNTMIPIIRKLSKRFGFEKPMVIADAGLLTKKNIKELEADGYEYILGARIRSQKQEMIDRIFSLKLLNGQSRSIELELGRRMVVSMSDARATKDIADRNIGIKKLEKKYKTNSLTKDKINNRGYNRFLTLEGNATVKIDYSKIEYDRQFDGLKGYITNSHLSDNKIIENYHYLAMIERAFRMNKTDLEIRPIYHRLFNRIEAHVCICFIAYTIMLELERILKASNSSISLDRAKFLTEKIQKIEYFNPFNRRRNSVIMKCRNNDEVHQLLGIVRKACNQNK